MITDLRSINLKKIERFSVNPIIGIYFLFYKDELIYIGQSEDIARRIQDHRKEKAFDSYSYITIPKCDLIIMEKRLIKYFNPKLNVVHKKKEIPLPPFLQTEQFDCFYNKMQVNSAKMYGKYFIAKLPTEMVHCYVSYTRIKGFYKYKLEGLKCEVISNGSAFKSKIHGWFKHKGKTYYFEPIEEEWRLASI